MATRGKFIVVRPYGVRLRQRVFAFLRELGFDLEEGGICEPRTDDTTAAEWVRGKNPALLLLPYHQHKTDCGKIVDGIGVAEQLCDEWLRRHGTIPIVMPVSKFSAVASFPRRLERLREDCPEVHARIIPMHETQIGSRELRARILTTAGPGPA